MAKGKKRARVNNHWLQDKYRADTDKLTRLTTVYQQRSRWRRQNEESIVDEESFQFVFGEQSGNNINTTAMTDVLPIWWAVKLVDFPLLPLCCVIHRSEKNAENIDPVCLGEDSVNGLDNVIIWQLENSITSHGSFDEGGRLDSINITAHCYMCGSENQNSSQQEETYLKNVHYVATLWRLLRWQTKSKSVALIRWQMVSS